MEKGNGKYFLGKKIIEVSTTLIMQQAQHVQSIATAIPT